MADTKVQAQKVVIEKNQGITQALMKLVQTNPNSVISDDKITLSEWNATMDKLAEINEKRKSENKESIFTGKTDKTKAGWHNSFIVQPNQEINFTAEEMAQLYTAMGVTFKAVEKDETKSAIDSTKVTPIDTTKLPPVDSTRVAPVDTAKVAPVVPDVADIEDDTEPSRYELSWKEVGKCAGKGIGKFLKSFFCKEDGKFSLGKTAATVGTAAAIIGAAPLAAALGASAAVVSGIGLVTGTLGFSIGLSTAIVGGVETVVDIKRYYDSTTREEALYNMESAWNDGTATAAGLAALWGFGKSAIKNLKQLFKIADAPQVYNTPKSEPVPSAEPDIIPDDIVLTPYEGEPIIFD